MKWSGALVVLAAVICSCVAPRPTVLPPTYAIMQDCPPAEPPHCPPCPILPSEACAPAAVRELRLPRAPPPPEVQWLAPGCPPQFGSCLSPEDAVRLHDYTEARRGR